MTRQVLFPLRLTSDLCVFNVKNPGVKLFKMIKVGLECNTTAHLQRNRNGNFNADLDGLT
jgi:hypothetical protein